jgi:hypothetical protein
MPLVNYREVHKDKIEARIQTKYNASIRQLRQLGFDEECYIQETIESLLGWVILWSGVLIAWFNGEILRFELPVKVSMFNPVLFHPEHGTYALINQMGVKFTTVFTEGAVLVNTNHSIENNIDNPRRKYQRTTHQGKSIADLWRYHENELERWLQAGDVSVDRLDVQDVIQLEHRHDSAILNLPDAKTKQRL